MTRTKLVLLVLVGFFVILQLVPVNQTNPDVIQDVNAPADANEILRESCYDCHSNETVWPWYSRIAPGSFLITVDVTKGRKHLNLSEFVDLDAFDSTDIANEIIEVLDEDEMPLPPYLILHPNASLSESERSTLKDWAKTLYPK